MVVSPSHRPSTQQEHHQQAVSPHHSPTCPKAPACPLHPQAASPTCPSRPPAQQDSHLCLVPPWALRIRLFLRVRVAQKGILPLLVVGLLLGWILGGEFDLGVY
jgi:hypothetical protein